MILNEHDSIHYYLEMIVVIVVNFSVFVFCFFTDVINYSAFSNINNSNDNNNNNNDVLDQTSLARSSSIPSSLSRMV